MHPLRARPSARPRHTGQAPVPRGAGGPEGDSRRLKGPHPRSGASTDCATLTRPEVSCPNSLSKPKPGTGHSPPQRQCPPSHARWPSPSLLAAQTSTPQSVPRTVTCRSALRGGSAGCLLPPSAQGQPHVPQEGSRVGTQPPSLGALVSSPVKGVPVL